MFHVGGGASLFLLHFALLADGVTKTWIKNTNYDNSDNWNLLRKPCGGDTAIFPQNLNGAVYVKDEQMANVILLPNDGQLIFGKDSELSFGSYDQSCAPKKIEFVRTGWNDWYDPDNWNNSDFVPIDADPNHSPIPHLERIPCHYDDVVFPPQSSFRVKIMSNSISVKSFTLNRQEYSTQSLKRYFSSEFGNNQFKVVGNVRVAEKSCTSQSGCLCGNHQPSVRARICSIAGLSCKEEACKNAIKPEGFCCKVCGSYLVVKFKVGFQYERMKRLVDSVLKQERFKKCRGYLSKIGSDEVQFVAVDDGSGQSTKLALTLKNKMGTDINSVGKLRLSSVRMYSSSDWNPNRDRKSDTATDAGKIVGIFFAVFVLLTLSVIGIFVLRKRRNADFHFVRFGADNKIEMELGGGTTHSDRQTGAAMSSRHAFDNPMYDAPSASQTEDKKTVEPPPPSSSKWKKTTEFTNPTFATTDDKF